MAGPDLTYACHDGIWTRFYPETPQGETAWNEMAKADPNGVVAQLKAAGYSVAKAPPVKPGELDAILAELDA
jgi:hypothetical protein